MQAYGDDAESIREFGAEAFAGVVAEATPLSRFMLEAAREVKEQGRFGYLDTTLPTPELNRFVQG